MTKIAEAKKEMTVYGKAELEQDSNIGMSKVDPLDIRPPSILIRQSNSDPATFTDKSGHEAHQGQYFHTGRLAILSEFECYFIFAAKGTYVDKRKPEDGEQPIYRCIGAMSDDLSLFGITFKSSAYYALSPLFTYARTNKRPLFSIRARVEVRKLQNEKGEWFVPAVKLIGDEEDQLKLHTLRAMAIKFDQNADKYSAGIGENPQDDDPTQVDPSIPF